MQVLWCFMELVVVPRSTELEATEEDLKLVLVVVVGGTRPPVSPAMVRAFLASHYGIEEASAIVHHHNLEDFMVRFSRHEDMELVLGTPVIDAPFSLIWCPWRRTSMVSGGSFRYKVLVRMRRVPLQARSVAMAQTILALACARVEIAPPQVTPQDYDREFFVANWCFHPRFIPEEKIIFIPEPNVHVYEGPLYLRADEVIHADLPSLWYLVWLRIVEYQDWNTPPSSSDDDNGHGGGAEDDDDFGDSNYNGYHPGFEGATNGQVRQS